MLPSQVSVAVWTLRPSAVPGGRLVKDDLAYLLNLGRYFGKALGLGLSRLGFLVLEKRGFSLIAR